MESYALLKSIKATKLDFILSFVVLIIDVRDITWYITLRPNNNTLLYNLYKNKVCHLIR